MKLKTKSEVIPTDPIQAATRRELLDAAAEVFGEAGYRNATVREICRRAGANIAAINYHFGDKEKLYADVLATLTRARWKNTRRCKASRRTRRRSRSCGRSFTHSCCGFLTTARRRATAN